MTTKLAYIFLWYTPYICNHNNRVTQSDSCSMRRRKRIWTGTLVWDDQPLRKQQYQAKRVKVESSVVLKFDALVSQGCQTLVRRNVSEPTKAKWQRTTTVVKCRMSAYVWVYISSIEVNYCDNEPCWRGIAPGSYCTNYSVHIPQNWHICVLLFLLPLRWLSSRT